MTIEAVFIFSNCLLYHIEYRVSFQFSWNVTVEFEVDGLAVTGAMLYQQNAKVMGSIPFEGTFFIRLRIIYPSFLNGLAAATYN